ncbi:MAG TPA: DUF4231 domain-containing protein [Blastocatellia bacterium]|nr:DUF4231 domain-containing protein [Blastocatellia bacterium]
MSANAMNKKNIRFSNHHEAAAVFPPADAAAKEIVMALGLPAYEAVIVVLGGADSIDEKLLPRLTQLFGRGIARAAVEARALILDGGTEAGVMKLMGEGVAGRGYKTPLVGVAPKDLVTYPPDELADHVRLEPNHSHFVLVEGDAWGSETATLFALAEAASQRETAPQAVGKGPQKDAEKADGKKLAVAILAGGGPVTRNEVLRAVRQNLSLIVIEGSGGLADEIAAAWRARPTLPDDPVMAEIIDDGEIHLHLLSNPVKGIERLIVRELGGDDVLLQAWETFADYDLNAKLQQTRFNRLQLAILVLGLLATTLAIVKQVSWGEVERGKEPLGYLILMRTLIVIPIALTVLVTVANRFKQGNKWLLLRAGAESIKREIYRYRVRAMYYKENPEQQLSQKVEDVTRRTMRTEVNATALRRYDKDQGFPPYMYAAQGGDDGFSILTPDRYIKFRLGDQKNYFRKKSLSLERRLRWLSWVTFIVGGVGTYLAAIDKAVWVALTTAVVAALGTYLAYTQTENTLTKYNQAATDLTNVKAWWTALPAEDQSKQENLDLLVEHTEQVLQSELDGWVQQMQNALDKLREDQEPLRQSPTLSSVTPDFGPPAGGTDVTLTGTHFVRGATVKFDGNDATDIVVSNATTIKAKTPAHAAGIVDVVVTNPDTQSATLTGGFTYKESPPAPPPPAPPKPPANPGGTPAAGGQPPASGQPPTGGQPPAGGQPPVGGQPPTGGQPPAGGGQPTGGK